MRRLTYLVFAALVACAGNSGGGSPGDDSQEPDAGTTTQPDSRTTTPDSGSSTHDDCFTDSCICPTTNGCQHTCSPGGNECHVQCAPGQSCDVTCAAGEECHVEAMTSAPPVKVNCSNATDCHVTCPSTGCTVTNCVGLGCQVTCGSTGAATINGTTASCP